MSEIMIREGMGAIKSDTQVTDWEKKGKVREKWKVKLLKLMSGAKPDYSCVLDEFNESLLEEKENNGHRPGRNRQKDVQQPSALGKERKCQLYRE